MPSDELRTLVRMYVCLLIANFNFLKRFIHLNRPINGADKVCGDSLDLKSPGSIRFTKKQTILNAGTFFKKA